MLRFNVSLTSKIIYPVKRRTIIKGNHDLKPSNKLMYITDG